MIIVVFSQLRNSRSNFFYVKGSIRNQINSISIDKLPGILEVETALLLIETSGKLILSNFEIVY